MVAGTKHIKILISKYKEHRYFYTNFGLICSKGEVLRRELAFFAILYLLNIYLKSTDYSWID